MLLNIIKAKAQQGVCQKIDVNCPLDDSLLQERGCQLLTAVHVVGEMCYKDDKLFLDAKAQVKLLCVCDNCGEEFEKIFDFAINETFVENYELHDEEDYVILQGAIDLSEVVQNNLLLSLSSRLLCRGDCKGLCPICGKNKNQFECNCEDIKKEFERQQENPFGKINR